MIFKFLIFSKDVILRGSVLWKSIIIAFWAFAFWCLTAPIPASAMVVRLKKEVNPISVKGGEWEADILVNNRKVKNVTAMGEWRVLKDKKSVFFTLTHIKKGNDYHTIQEQPSAKENVAKNKTFKKGRRIILGGENDSEISQILGVDKKTYSKTKKGNESGGGTSSGGSDSESSSSSLGGGSGSGGLGGRDEDTLASNDSSSSGGGSSGGGSNGGNDNGVIGGGGNNGGGNGGNNGGGNIPLPPFGGGDDNGGGNGGYVPPSIGGGGDNNNNGNTKPPVIINPDPDNGGNNGGGNGGNNDNPNYSTQYCKPPQRVGNEMSLSVIDKAGNCLEIKAGRDDTKCEYRYDFGNKVAIKQTQFYYVDLENVTQNIGGCVDLEPEKNVSHRYQLYTSDTKCKLNVTEDKDYAGGKVFEFQKQILFRGADGMVHIARDCGDYAIVEEELLEYRYDKKTQTLFRIVNRFYKDPFTQEKIYISKGVESPYKFKTREYMCGKWEYDDKNLQAYRPTQIKTFDEIANQYYNITGCDYTPAEGKTGKIIQAYTKDHINVDSTGSTEGDINTAPEAGDTLEDQKRKDELSTFVVKEQILKYTGDGCIRTKCHDTGSDLSAYYYYSKCFPQYSVSDTEDGYKVFAKWKTQYRTISRGVTERYIRPRQEGDSDRDYDLYKFYYVSKAEKIIERIPIYIDSDILGLNQIEGWMQHYEIAELTRKLNVNEESLILLNTAEYQKWQSKYYRPKGGNKCQAYSISGGNRKPDGGKVLGISYNYCKEAWVDRVNASCSTPNNYLIPDAPKGYVMPKSFNHLPIMKDSIIGRGVKKDGEKIKMEREKTGIEKMREYEKALKKAKGGK